MPNLSKNTLICAGESQNPAYMLAVYQTLVAEASKMTSKEEDAADRAAESKLEGFAIALAYMTEDFPDDVKHSIRDGLVAMRDNFTQGSNLPAGLFLNDIIQRDYTLKS